MRDGATEKAAIWCCSGPPGHRALDALPRGRQRLHQDYQAGLQRNDRGSDPTITNCDGRQEAFEVSSGVLLHRWQTSPGGSWSGWYSLGGYLIYTRIAVFDNVTCHLEVVGVGGDGAMWHIWQTNAGSGPWSGWASLGGGYFTGRANAFRGSRAAAGTSCGDGLMAAPATSATGRKTVAAGPGVGGTRPACARQPSPPDRTRVWQRRRRLGLRSPSFRR